MTSHHTDLQVGKKSHFNLVYQCSNCGEPQPFLSNQVTFRCPHCKSRSHVWRQTDQELVPVSHDEAQEVAKPNGPGERFSNWAMGIFGHIYFVYLHIAWFSLWITYNMVAPNPFDPFPFGLLTMIVSLEAIVLSALILIAQNRQSEASELRAKLDYNADLKAERNTKRIIGLLKAQVRKGNSPEGGKGRD